MEAFRGQSKTCSKTCRPQTHRKDATLATSGSWQHLMLNWKTSLPRDEETYRLTENVWLIHGHVIIECHFGRKTRSKLLFIPNYESILHVQKSWSICYRLLRREWCDRIPNLTGCRISRTCLHLCARLPGGFRMSGVTRRLPARLRSSNSLREAIRVLPFLKCDICFEFF